jgi:hypothetical protein
VLSSLHFVGRGWNACHVADTVAVRSSELPGDLAWPWYLAVEIGWTALLAFDGQVAIGGSSRRHACIPKAAREASSKSSDNDLKYAIRPLRCAGWHAKTALKGRR